MPNDKPEEPDAQKLFESLFGDPTDPATLRRRLDGYRRDLGDSEERARKLKRRVLSLESDARSLQLAARELAVAGLYGAIILVAALAWAAYRFDANWLQWMLLATFGIGAVSWFRGLCRHIDAVGRRA